MLEDKEEVISILLDYYLIIKHKCCLDQFGEGLQTLGILSAVQRNPCLWKTLFVTSDAGLSTGKVLTNVQVVIMKCIFMCMHRKTKRDNDSTVCRERIQP